MYQGGLCAELFHLVLFWVQYHSTSTEDDAHLTALLDEMLLLLGYICLSHPQNADMARMGLADPLIKRLAQLPFTYFTNHVLLPTLIVLCSRDTNRLIVQDELSMRYLTMYIEKETEVMRPHADKRMHLANRIPKAVVEESYSVLMASMQQ